MLTFCSYIPSGLVKLTHTMCLLDLPRLLSVANWITDEVLEIPS